MQLKIFGKGFNYSQDGPGNRLVYHLQGCNMHCPWCSNPEGMDPNKGGYSVDADALLEEIVRSSPMFFEGGGVTFTGGEATLQAEALAYLLSGARSRGINTALETNGASPLLPTLFDNLDHLMIDCKHTNDDRLRQTVGLPFAPIRQNILAAAEHGVQLTLRIPLIGGFNNSAEAIEGFVSFFSELKGYDVKAEVLKYHEYGKEKWQKCGLEYKMVNAFVTEEERLALESRLRETGVTVVRT